MANTSPSSSTRTGFCQLKSWSPVLTARSASSFIGPQLESVTLHTHTTTAAVAEQAPVPVITSTTPHCSPTPTESHRAPKASSVRRTVYVHACASPRQSPRRTVLCDASAPAVVWATAHQRKASPAVLSSAGLGSTASLSAAVRLRQQADAAPQAGHGTSCGNAPQPVITAQLLGSPLSAQTRSVSQSGAVPLVSSVSVHSVTRSPLQQRRCSTQAGPPDAEGLCGLPQCSPRLVAKHRISAVPLMARVSPARDLGCSVHRYASPLRQQHSLRPEEFCSGAAVPVTTRGGRSEELGHLTQRGESPPPRQPGRPQDAAHEGQAAATWMLPARELGRRSDSPGAAYVLVSEPQSHTLPPWGLPGSASRRARATMVSYSPPRQRLAARPRRSSSCEGGRKPEARAQSPQRFFSACGPCQASPSRQWSDGSVLCAPSPNAKLRHDSPSLARLYSAPAMALPPPPGLGPMMQGVLSSVSAVAAKGPEPSVPACLYTADPSDMMDRLLMVHLMAVDQEASSKLMIRRLGSGKYEIDGRCVTLRWGVEGEQGGSAHELFVCEDEVGGDAVAMEMPLSDYIDSVANVAASLGGHVPGAPAVARIPQEQRLTFGSPGSGALENVDLLQRCASMRKACEEARLREKAAEAYENGRPFPVSGRNAAARCSSRRRGDQFMSAKKPARV